MLEYISRTEVFRRSALVDYYISNIQQDWHDEQLDSEDDFFMTEDCVKTENPYDHLQPFHKKAVLRDDFAVLAYPAINRNDYITNCPLAVARFCKLMGIRRLYLMNVLKCDWLYFPFENNEKLVEFKNLIKGSQSCEAFELDIVNLPHILPLFFFSLAGAWQL